MADAQCCTQGQAGRACGDLGRDHRVASTRPSRPRVRSIPSAHAPNPRAMHRSSQIESLQVGVDCCRDARPLRRRAILFSFLVSRGNQFPTQDIRRCDIEESRAGACRSRSGSPLARQSTWNPGHAEPLHATRSRIASLVGNSRDSPWPDVLQNAGAARTCCADNLKA